MLRIGLDPGLSGGIAAIGPEGAHAWPMPVIKTTKGKKTKTQYDINLLAERLSVCKIEAGGDILAVLEWVGAMPGQGVTSMFRMGEGFGILQGLLVGLGIPFIKVRPVAWKKVVLSGTQKDKTAAIQFCLQRYPVVPLILPRCRKHHDGMADALCLAHYGATQ